MLRDVTNAGLPDSGQESNQEALPLQGIRVIDLSVFAEGPIAAALLGDMGADVIKLERLGIGDPTRGVLTMEGKSIITQDGKNILWELCNRNKRDIALDLETTGGKEIIGRLVERSDVFVTNINPETLERLQLDYMNIRRRNPKIIYALAGGLGQEGPYGRARCQDTIGMANSGFMFNHPEPDGSPVYNTIAISDITAGTMLAFGIMTALLSRERHGMGQMVYSSQLASMMWLQGLNIATFCNMGYDFEPRDRRRAANPLMNLYKCEDGRWLALGLYSGTRYWSDFCNVLGPPGKELQKDPNFATDTDRMQNRTQLIARIDTIFASRPRNQWIKLFNDAGLLCNAVNRVADLPNDPQVMANEYLTNYDGTSLPAPPFDLSVRRVLPKCGAPQFGQHTEEVLQTVCEYSWEELAELKEKKVII